MHPELFRIPYAGEDRPVYSYGVLILVGMAVGIAVGARRATRHGVEPFDVVAVGLLSAVFGMVCAWLLFAAIHWRLFLADPGEFLRQPGMVFYGGFAGGTGAAIAYLRAFKIPFFAVADIAAVGLSLGHGIGRIGCFLGGCCYGRPTDSFLGVTFTDPHTPAAASSALHGALHPVQLYEAAGLFAISGLCALFYPRLSGRPRGTLFVIYLALYALLRLATEGLRGDFFERGKLLLLSTSQAIAVAMLAAAGLLYFILHRLTLPRKERIA
ncbi:MAG: hypothetical protein EXR72_23425 [Myxococcales bacterium]|nr:hypothetical protein [Myxococcales bacterium]